MGEGATAAWAILAVRPFTWPAHAWSVPVRNLWRPFVPHRSRTAAHPAEPGTNGPLAPHRRPSLLTVVKTA
ncbi:hypothetical protein [Streptomyces misionensis]|uniref:hypothetical protein n=1 Tax=Streptomyces misionensis TaxID=67331 RepID=UPI00368F1C09